MNFPNTLITSLAIVASLILSTSASAKPTDAPAKKVTYEDDVKPIFRELCLNCHNQGDKRGGLALDSYGAMMEGGGSGEIVYDDGDADGSRLWQLVNHDDTPVMPPQQPKMDAAKLEVIRAWIEGGVLENSGSKAKAKKKNALAFAGSSTGKPDGPPPMPKSLPQRVPVLTSRAPAISAIAASPWAPLVAIAGQKQISLYHADTNELLGILPFEEGIAQSLRFSRDGRYLVAGGGEHSVRGIAAVYNIENGERVATVGDELDTVFDADCNDTMSRIALGGPQKMLRIYDATDGTQLFDLKKHTDWIYAVAFSPDGVLVASGDRSGGLCVWEADTGRLYLDLTDHKGAIRSLSWRDDSNVLASASEDGTVKLWDMVSGKAVKSFGVGGGGVTAVRFDHKGQLLAASKDRKARLFDGSGKQIKEFPPMSEAVLEVAISHDSKHAIYGDWAGQVQITSIDDPKQSSPLAANPPAAKERLQAVEQMLASTKAKLQPLAQAKQVAAEKVKQLTAALTKTQSDLNAQQAAIGDSENAVKATTNQVNEIVNKLPQLEQKTRAVHDQVIAGRLTHQDPRSTPAVEAIAKVEQQLAAELNQLVEQRKLVLTLQTQIAEKQQQIQAGKAKLPALQQAITQAQAAVDAANQGLEAATKAHDSVASELSEQEQKKQALAAAAS